ncbi:MAG: formimidoylglutamase [Rhodothermales bacterium]
MLTPAAILKPSTAPDDPRIGHLIRPGTMADLAAQPRCVLLGFPSDEGVRRNGGRVGARDGPSVLRSWLYRLTPDPVQIEAFRALCQATLDLGDVMCSGDLEADQAALGEVVHAVLEAGAIPIILGGGHETSWGHIQGYIRQQQPFRVVNIDAHPDVRPLRDGQAHSGSPFYQALTMADGFCQAYHVAGLNPSTIAAAHLQRIEHHSGTAHFAEACSPALWDALYYTEGAPMLATFDLDALDQAAAPGVSAPNAWGLSPKVWLSACEAAGRSPQVVSFDIVELNPAFDRDHQTARLAALSVWHILRGLALRGSAD